MRLAVHRSPLENTRPIFQLGQGACSPQDFIDAYEANSREMCDSEPQDMSPSPPPEGAHHNQRQTTYDKCYIPGVEQSYEIRKWYVTIHRFLANVLH